MTQKVGAVALFGGSFDPPHAGHLAVAASARKHFGFDRIIFVPCNRSPHKNTPTGASGIQRMEMLKLLTASLSWAEVSDFEISQPPPSFTWVTVEHFAKEAGAETKLFWILGADQWKNIGLWNRSERLAKMLHFIVVARGGFQFQCRPGYDATLLEVAHPASSTQIRNLMAWGYPPPEDWISGEQLAYIKEHQLYREPLVERTDNESGQSL